jgi:Matrixin
VLPPAPQKLAGARKKGSISPVFTHGTCFIEIMMRSQPSKPSLPSQLNPQGRRFTKFIACLALVGACTGIPRANGYSLEPGNPEWSPGNVTFVLSFGGGSRSLSDGSTSWDQAGAAALAVWNQYMQSVQLNIVTNDSAPVSQRDGVNSVAFSSTFFGSSFGSNTLGITGYSYSGGRMTEANTLLSTHWTWDSYRGPQRNAVDIRRVLIHEIGHALGLDHPDQHGQHVAAVMNSVISNIDTAVTDDINGIQAIYGARTGGGGTPTPTPNPTATPTPTPTPNPTATPVFRSASISGGPTIVRTGQTATFTVSISSASTSPVTVAYMTGGSAKGSLYSLSGTPRQVTIPAGATSANFTLTVTGRPRRAKTATIFLLNGSSYTLSGSRSASITISR